MTTYAPSYLFEKTPLTFPHYFYLACAISEVSANTKLNAPRYHISFSFQMKAGVTELLYYSMFSECHIMYRIPIISDQNAKFSNVLEFTQQCPFWSFRWSQHQNICWLQCCRTKTNSLFSIAAKTGKLSVWIQRDGSLLVICILACPAAEAGSMSAVVVAVGRIERKLMKGSEGTMTYKPCVPLRRAELNGPVGET